MSKTPKGQIYRGRFAPSPSGPLHFGSLIAALGSYLQARSLSGEWLVRIEDLDPPRESPGADILILKSLEAHGLNWDGDIMYQSQRHDAYEQALSQLEDNEHLFYCSCTNKQLKSLQKNTNNIESTLRNGVYPGICRTHKKFRENCAIRMLVNDKIISFTDKVYGEVNQNLQNEVGAFVLKRRDGLYAYQLAVVVDDIAQGINEVVRGVDLLDSTPRQLFLYQCFNTTPPDYLHLPLALMTDKKKLSKQTGAEALHDDAATRNLISALQFLGQTTPEHLNQEPVNTIINWGISNWDVSKIPTQDIVI